MEDFVSPQTRHIQYNQLTDAKKPKKARGGIFRRKPTKTDNDVRNGWRKGDKND